MKEVFVSSIRDESEEIFNLAKDFNLGLEVLGFIMPYEVKNLDEQIKVTKKKLIDINKRSLHGPFIDLSPGVRDPEIVKVVKNRFLNAYEIAKSINAKHLILHAGFIPKAYFPDSWLETSIDFWKDFLSLVDDDIEIHIENVCEDDYSLIRDLIKEVNNPRLSACLDIGHANINSSKTLEEWIKGLNYNIKYVHLHNNYGVSDDHYGLLRGDINILKVLELLEVYAPKAKWSLETKLNETEESVLWLEKNGFIKR